MLKVNTNMIAKIIQTASKNPRQLFLIDGLGAIVTAFLTGIVLVYFESFFGMPKSILIPLALVACGFSVYSLTCYFTNIRNWQFLLRIIAVANLLYCGVTMGFVVYYFELLTSFGLLYFLSELLIIVVLVMIEWKVAKISPTDFAENAD